MYNDLISSKIYDKDLKFLFCLLPMKIIGRYESFRIIRVMDPSDIEKDMCCLLPMSIINKTQMYKYWLSLSIF